MVLAHGGTAGLALELGFLLVPLLCIVILLWWGNRHARPGQDGTSGDSGGKESGVVSEPLASGPDNTASDSR